MNTEVSSVHHSLFLVHQFYIQILFFLKNSDHLRIATVPFSVFISSPANW